MRLEAIRGMRGYLSKGVVALGDAMLVLAALYGAYLIRFDFSLTQDYWKQLFNLLPVFVLIRVTALYYTRSYHFVWKYTSVNDLIQVLKAVLAGTALLAVINYFRNYPFALLLAVGFFLSALFHRGVLHALPRLRHKRLLIFGFFVASLPLMGIGVLAYTVVSSAPITYEIPWIGGYLERLDFPYDLVMPRGVLIMESILSFILLSSMRVAPRLFYALLPGGRNGNRRVLVFGAGDLGESIVRMLKQQPGLGYFPVGFVDDDPAKKRLSIHGVGVLGTRRELAGLIVQRRVDGLLIAVPSLSSEDLRELAAACRPQRVFMRRVPGLSGLLDPRVGLKNLENVDIEALLGRQEIELDPMRVRQYLQDRVVLVTGAGGSIGSELCRQVSRLQPARLILLGKGENSIYLIEKELEQKFPELERVSVIADICNKTKMDFVFRTYRPEVVFHAAAYKHVPFMEDSPEESVINNVFGTQTVAQAALQHKVDRFVLISSDKAVNPSSTMGATKKVAELILQKLSTAGETQFITVRFGNVLRSRGSVIPLFERQIEAGGPVTVTHPEMKRYFMSIPEAVRLVLHSGAVGRSGELCILDMGEQVRIVELARNMIRMAGKRLDQDIDIVFTGIRPGEKLYEELFSEAEAHKLRKVDKIFICRPEGCDWVRFEEMLEHLRQAAVACRRDEVENLLRRMLRGYRQVEPERHAPQLAPAQPVH